MMQTDQIARLRKVLPSLATDLTTLEESDRFLMLTDSADARPVLKRGRLLMETMQRIPFEMMSQQAGAQLTTHFDNLNRYLPPIAEFVRSENQVPPNLESNLRECMVAIQAVFEHTAPYIATLVYISGEWNEPLERALRTAKAESESANKMVETLKGRLTEAEGIITKIRNAAAVGAVSSHAKHFADEAENRRKEGWRWLMASIVTASLTIITAIIFFFVIGTPLGHEVIPHIAGRVVILSILLFATIWSGKNYRATRHLQMVNTHRAISLRTFEAFAEAASGNQDIRNAVLLETTRSIFSSVPTGFLETKDSGGEVQSHWIEIAKSFRSEQ